MPNQKRPLLRMKGQELALPDEDRLIEVSVYDALLPCRMFEISYKVAVLGSVSPTLEFLLRLVKAAPGIEEEEAAAFFGFSRSEMAYVMEEARQPGFVNRDQNRLWLTSAGERLFSANGDEPLIYSVESRRRSHGFDLLSTAPQAPRRLDAVEWNLPELPIRNTDKLGALSGKIEDRFRYFFQELSDRADKEQMKRRDLYSIEAIAPKDRFQIPVRVRAYALASNPHVIEKIDLGSWRPEPELIDRREIEDAAFLLAENTTASANQLQAKAAYDILGDLAPDFLKEFITREGLNVRRYWKEAISRVGDPRSDRKTITMVGSLTIEGNIERLSSVLEYGLKNGGRPTCALSVAPQVLHWGATTRLQDLLALIRRKTNTETSDNSAFRTIWLGAGKPEKYLKSTYDVCRSSDRPEFPRALEMLLVPRTMVAVLVHSPVGSPNGHAVPLGFASFDPGTIERASSMVLERLDRFDLNQDEYEEISDAFELYSEFD